MVVNKFQFFSFQCKSLRIGVILLMVIGSQNLDSQITVLNPSFEDTPADATTPHGWFPCEAFTTPDILPGFWGVYTKPTDGRTFVGLITRENGSWESIGQRLSHRLESSNCYTFSIDLACSKTYAGFNKPLQLRIWLGSQSCKKDQLIYESSKIGHPDWKKYQVTFSPDSDYQHIILEAYYKEPPFKHKGNILLDNMGSIKFCGRA